MNLLPQTLVPVVHLAFEFLERQAGGGGDGGFGGAVAGLAQGVFEPADLGGDVEADAAHDRFEWFDCHAETGERGVVLG